MRNCIDRSVSVQINNVQNIKQVTVFERIVMYINEGRKVGRYKKCKKGESKVTPELCCVWIDPYDERDVMRFRKLANLSNPK